MRIKDADAGDEFIRVTTHPFADSRLVSNLISDIHDRLGWSNARYDVSKNLLLPTCTARLLEDSDIAGLTCTVVAVDNGKAGCELEGLIFRERVYTLVMKYRIRDTAATVPSLSGTCSLASGLISTFSINP